MKSPKSTPAQKWIEETKALLRKHGVEIVLPPKPVRRPRTKKEVTR